MELGDDALIISMRVKGGDNVGRDVRDPSFRSALLNYLKAPLTSHAFALNMKGYAGEAGIKDFHLHQMRHTFARLVAERTGSSVETQDALGHKNPVTMRVYVQRIAVKRDKHSEEIARLLNLEGGVTSR